jgi:hypothetical protein
MGRFVLEEGEEEISLMDWIAQVCKELIESKVDIR